MIRSTGITFRYGLYVCATKKTDLAFCTSYKDETSADGEHQVYKTYSS